MGDAEGGFYLCVADDIVFSEFLHTERVEGEVEPTAKFGDAVHQSLWQAPDVGFLSHCLADDCNQFIGRKGLVASHMVNSGRNWLIRNLHIIVSIHILLETAIDFSSNKCYGNDTFFSGDNHELNISCVN